MKVKRNTHTKRMTDLLTSNPQGLRSRDLVKKGIPATTVSWHLKRLVTIGKVERIPLPRVRHEHGKAPVLYRLKLKGEHLEV